MAAIVYIRAVIVNYAFLRIIHVYYYRQIKIIMAVFSQTLCPLSFMDFFPVSVLYPIVSGFFGVLESHTYSFVVHGHWKLLNAWPIEWIVSCISA